MPACVPTLPLMACREEDQWKNRPPQSSLHHCGSIFTPYYHIKRSVPKGLETEEGGRERDREKEREMGNVSAEEEGGKGKERWRGSGGGFAGWLPKAPHPV